jgi:2-polyprenyl-3-methyl-5-hydroxy-6-metoxy-1,4-benzoquinol methylase
MRKKCNSVNDCIEEKVPVFNKYGYEILECKVCNHRFIRIDNDFEAHLRDVYSDAYFFDGKAGYPNYLDNKGILIKHGANYAKIISRFIDKPGSILDVGSSAGFILKGFEQSGWNCSGIEPNKTMAEYCIKEFGIDVQIGSLETYEADKKFDLITLLQVIGHFQDIDKAMRKTHNLLKTDGLVLVESWNRNSIIARLFGRYWHEYYPPSVIHWFSDRTLIDLFDFYGFTFISKGLPLKRINLKHAISLIAGEKAPKKIINLLEKSIGKLPVVYPPVDLRWYVFKKRSD